MIELDFQQFHDQKYREKRYELYVLKMHLAIFYTLEFQKSIFGSAGLVGVDI